MSKRIIREGAGAITASASYWLDRAAAYLACDRRIILACALWTFAFGILGGFVASADAPMTWPMLVLLILAVAAIFTAGGLTDSLQRERARERREAQR